MGKNVFVNILDISIFINHCEVDIFDKIHDLKWLAYNKFYLIWEEHYTQCFKSDVSCLKKQK